MAKARPHFWRLQFQRFRKEPSGVETPMTLQGTLVVPDNQFRSKDGDKAGWVDDLPPVSETLNYVRKGRRGIVDAVLFEMQRLVDAAKKGKRK